jgi:hypothetical protein
VTTALEDHFAQKWRKTSAVVNKKCLLARTILGYTVDLKAYNLNGMNATSESYMACSWTHIAYV